jgi:4-hydroxyacetophenone monooxygenase
MVRQELLQASDAVIEDALEHVDPLVLRGLLYQLTGDEAVAAVPVAMVPGGFRGQMPGIVDPDHVGLLRAKAAEFLKAYRDGGAGDCPFGPETRLHRSMELAVGEPVPLDQLGLWTEQMGLDPETRGLIWRREPDPVALAGFKVAVIGTGMGGLNAAVRLKRAGIPFTMFEKNHAVGGTWHENRYPGARVDSLSRIYFNSYGIGFPIPSAFCLQPVNEAYFNWVADHFDLRDDIRFGTEVTAARWNDARQLWEIETLGPEGRSTSTANAVISSVGFLSRGHVPEFEGQGDFDGEIFHTSRWPDGLDLTGKKVAVVGSGASSYQMIPELVKQVDHLTLFQRTPSWCLEVKGYLSPYAPQVGWLDRNFPWLAHFLRFQTSWQTRPESLWDAIQVVPGKEGRHGISEDNDRVRDQCMALLSRKFGDRPDLLAKMIPDTPPFSTRPVLIDSDYSIYDCLKMYHVALVSDPIARFTKKGVLTEAGEEVAVDAIILATGFKANDFLWPMEIVGREGRTLGNLWEKDGARAYLGTMLPGFPNFFMIYGPNMNPMGSGLGVVDFQEMAARFALKCVEHLILEGKGSVDLTDQGYLAYNAELDRRQAPMVYLDPRVRSYYRNAHGRSAVNNAYDVRLLWNWLRDPSDPRDEVAAQAGGVIRPFFGDDLVVR